MPERTRSMEEEPMPPSVPGRAELSGMLRVRRVLVCRGRPGGPRGGVVGGR